jgi:hypothetical protein
MKYQIYIASIISLLFFSCKSNYKLNQKIRNKKILSQRGLILVPSANLEKHIKLKDSLSLGLNENNIIIYVATDNPSFIITDLRIGSKLTDIPNYKNKTIINSKGFAYSIKIDDVWYAGFDYKKTLTNDSEILFFFQYKFHFPLEKTKTATEKQTHKLLGL